jgi:hypothetical protein
VIEGTEVRLRPNCGVQVSDLSPALKIPGLHYLLKGEAVLHEDKLSERDGPFPS